MTTDTAIMYPDEAEILGIWGVVPDEEYTIREDLEDPAIYWIDSKKAKGIRKIASRNIDSELLERIQENGGALTVVIKEYNNWWEK